MRKRILHGPAMKQIRLLSGIRQTDFATQCLITPGYLSNLEAGRKQPAEDMLKRLADELGVALGTITYVITAESMEGDEA